MSEFHVGSNVPTFSPEGEPFHAGSWVEALQVLEGDLREAFNNLPWELPTDDEQAVEDEYWEAIADVQGLIKTAEDLASWEDGLGPFDDVSYTLPTSIESHDLGRAYWIARCESPEYCHEEDDR